MKIREGFGWAWGGTGYLSIRLINFISRTIWLELFDLIRLKNGPNKCSSQTMCVNHCFQSFGNGMMPIDLYNLSSERHKHSNIFPHCRSSIAWNALDRWSSLALGGLQCTWDDKQSSRLRTQWQTLVFYQAHSGRWDVHWQVCFLFHASLCQRCGRDVSTKSYSPYPEQHRSVPMVASDSRDSGATQWSRRRCTGSFTNSEALRLSHWVPGMETAMSGWGAQWCKDGIIWCTELTTWCIQVWQPHAVVWLWWQI